MKRIQVLHNGKVKSLPANEARVLLLLKKATLVPQNELPPAEPIFPVVVTEKVSLADDGEIVVIEPHYSSDATIQVQDDKPQELGEFRVLADAEDAAPEVEISPRTGKPKRTYRRRDMTAGDE